MALMSADRLARPYDFIVCGSGSSGSVVARRLAENPDVTVLLLEAGGTDEVPAVMDAALWPLNLGSERDWGFLSEPSPQLDNRSIPLPMGKVLGGGSSINGMVWARGHRNDWDYFAAEAGDDAWSYRAVLNIYRRIEDWHGKPDPELRGCGGPVFIEPAPDTNAVTHALLDGARSIGIPTYDSNNGAMMEGAGGASIFDCRVRNGQRQSVFRSYVHPFRDRPNLTVLDGALVTRVVLDGNRATGVTIYHQGVTRAIDAGSEVILSLGAINTPKVLMQSGIGDAADLQRLGIPVAAELPGVGCNYQDHPRVDCVWEYQQTLPPRNVAGDATLFWRSLSALDGPDLQISLTQIPVTSAECAARFEVPEQGWTISAVVVRPQSCGTVRLTGPDPGDPVQVDANLLSHPNDMTAMTACVELSRGIGNSPAMRPFATREVMPGDLKGPELADFIRTAAVTIFHSTGTAKMGRDGTSVVDGDLKVYGIDRLRIADGSIMPRITTGNTMAPCLIIGERAADILTAQHRL